MSDVVPPTMFIYRDEHTKKFVVEEEVIKKLSGLKNSYEVCVVSISGAYRTGKSLLMNLFFGQMKGFELGPTVQSCTKGIWCWGRILNVGGKEKLFLLLDCEGLEDTERSDLNYDATIFSLAILLGSHFIYNSRGQIEEGSIRKLNLVTNLTNHIRVRSGGDENGEEFDAFFPYFSWVVRDFFLGLEVDGKECSPDEYLELALKLKRGYSSNVTEANAVRGALRDFFKQRKCFVLCKPVDDDEKLKHVENEEYSSLKPEFRRNVEQLVSYVLNRTPAKSHKSVKLTPRMFGNLAKEYVESINNGSVPNICDGFDSLVKIENSAAVKEAIEYYSKEMNKSVKGKLPLELEQLTKIHSKVEKGAIELFNSKVFSARDMDTIKEYSKQLQNGIAVYEKGVLKGGCYFKISQSNDKASEEKCKKILKKEYLVIEKKLRDRAYFSPKGSFDDYRNDQLRVVRNYEKCKSKGTKAAEVLASFLNSKKPEAEQLISSNKMMKEKEKHIARERLKKEEMEREAKKANEMNEKLKQERIDEQKAFKAHIEAIRKKQEEDLASLKKENERVLNTRLGEQEKLLKEGFKEEAALLQESIDNMKRDNERLSEQNQDMVAKYEEMKGNLEKQITDLKNRPPQVIKEVHHHHESGGGGCLVM